VAISSCTKLPSTPGFFAAKKKTARNHSGPFL